VRIKTVIVDLDRTLLRSDKTLSAHTAAVLNRCRAEGIELMIATARPQRAVAQYLQKVSFDALTVSNGARIICGSVRRDILIPEESAACMLRGFCSHPGLCVTLETGDCAYSNRPISEYETILCNDLAGRAELEGAMKLLVHMEPDTDRESVQKLLTGDVYHTLAHGNLIQVMNKSATKWSGIKTMLEMRGFSPDEAVYFGDDEDDVEAIMKCGTGVAVRNAIETVRSEADYITESNDEDGVAGFISRFVLSSL